jgi:glycerol-3-phosphate acyltransferase PlsY
MLLTIVALLVSYLLGSIPTAYLFGKVVKGIDIRKVGSGNVGATNALRVLGKSAGITVLVIDILKGLIAVTLLADLFVDKPILWQAQNLRIFMGLCCICGHNWTVFLQFKGGKGIATSFGVLIGLALKIQGLGLALAIIIVLWFVIFFATRIVSLASVLAAIGLPVACMFLQQSRLMIAVAWILCIFVIIRHKANLVRIFQGQESRLYFKKSKTNQ